MKAMEEKVPLPSWGRAPDGMSLGMDEVHVWRASIDPDGLDVQGMWATLAADERSRAGRFYFQKDRERFVAGRGLLRAILGRYLGMDSDQLQFCYNSYGKPALTRESGGEILLFNLSHSHGLMVCAVTRHRQIGIDLERICGNLAGEKVAERFFSPREVGTLRALPACIQGQAFFNCWTRKEAFIKAKGQGLSLPLDQFDVSLRPGEPAALLDTTWDPQEACRWSLKELDPGPGYVCALCVEGRHWQLKCCEWSTQHLPRTTVLGCQYT